jgi:hypothetical protein
MRPIGETGGGFARPLAVEDVYCVIVQFVPPYSIGQLGTSQPLSSRMRCHFMPVS